MVCKYCETECLPANCIDCSKKVLYHSKKNKYQLIDSIITLEHDLDKIKGELIKFLEKTSNVEELHHADLVKEYKQLKKNLSYDCLGVIVH